MIIVLLLVLTLFTPAKKAPAPAPGGRQTAGLGAPASQVTATPGSSSPHARPTG
jgi:hypothetical protein